MSQPSTYTADQAAEKAVIAHHAELAAQLDQRAEALIKMVEGDRLIKAETARRDLVNYARRDIIPHALAEEQSLYPPAADLPEGHLLVAGMIAEHHMLMALVDEVAEAGTLVRAATAARALSTLFAAHLHKENDLVLPLLLTAPDVALSRILVGMHELLGADHTVDEGSATGPSDGGCGCGGCGCGSEADDRGDPPAASVLAVDTRLDVRDVPHDRRHALVLSTVGALPPGQAVVLVASHAPRPVLAEIDAQFGGQVQAQWLQSGPQVWQVRLERVAQAA